MQHNAFGHSNCHMIYGPFSVVFRNRHEVSSGSCFRVSMHVDEDSTFRATTKKHFYAQMHIVHKNMLDPHPDYYFILFHFSSSENVCGRPVEARGECTTYYYHLQSDRMTNDRMTHICTCACWIK